MKIMPNNLKRQYELHAAEYEKKALEVLRGGWYILGHELETFETEFADINFCVAIFSCWQKTRGANSDG